MPLPRVTAQQITAAAGIATALATIALVIVAQRELSQIPEQIRIQDERQRKWATVEACDAYVTDPVIYQASKNLWVASQNGTDYSDKDAIDAHDVATLLNYLESLATGVEQGVYVEEIVRDHFEGIMTKAVLVFIQGKSSENWRASDPYFPEEAVPGLMTLYMRWQTPKPRFHDEENG